MLSIYESKHQFQGLGAWRMPRVWRPRPGQSGECWGALQLQAVPGVGGVSKAFEACAQLSRPKAA